MLSGPGWTPGLELGMSLWACTVRATISSSRIRRARLAGHLLHDRDGALTDECDGHRVGAHAVACDAAGGVGGAQESRSKLTVFRHDMCALKLPRYETSGVEMMLTQFGCFVALPELRLKLHSIPPHCFAAECARLTAPRATHNAARTSGRQLSIPDRFAGLLAENIVHP